MNDVHDRSLHCSGLQVAVGAAVDVPQRLAQVLGIFDVDSDELEDAILGQDTDYHGALCFVIDVDQRNTTSAGLEHATTCRVERLKRMHRDCLDGLYADSFLNIAQTVKTELIDLGEGIWVLPVVLNDVDVVRGSQEASEGRGLRVPKRSRDNACCMSAEGR